jgi:hypothetical protein
MLTDFKNDLFATHVDMGSALIYVNTLYSGTSTPHDSLVMRTAVHIVINTAIEMHRAEKQVLVDKINELSAQKDPVTALLTLVREQVNLAVAEQSHAVTAAVDGQIENWMADNLQDHVNECYDMEEKIAEQISEYFNSNTFSISSN